MLYVIIYTERKKEVQTMKTITLNTNFERTYKNNGQHAEQVMRFTLTGEICKADNVPHTEGGDIWDIQIKSARATVCKGTDLDAYLAMDGAERFAYVTKDFQTAYIMNREEWKEFVHEFGCITRDSMKNGGHEKIALLSESRRMIEWFTTK